METKKLRALDPLLHPQAEDLLHQDSQFVERFYELITQSIEPPFAISIDGLWGTGKTTVMKMLQEKLRDEYSTFWFNPWEYGKTDSIVLAFLQDFASVHKYQIDELRNGGTMFKILLRAGMEAVLKINTKGNISLRDVETELKELEEGGWQQISYESYESSIYTIKREFQELVNRVGAKYSKKTIIFFFDDLDRCLPDDAIQLLEAIKNLFMTPDCNAIFICGIDTRIAKNFISNHYKGIADNFAINYFRKIFNLTISMPSNSSIYVLLLEHIKKLYGWDDETANPLVNIIYTRGVQAELRSIRKYLNIINNGSSMVAMELASSYSFTPIIAKETRLIFVDENS